MTDQPIPDQLCNHGGAGSWHRRKTERGCPPVEPPKLTTLGDVQADESHVWAPAPEPGSVSCARCGASISLAGLVPGSPVVLEHGNGCDDLTAPSLEVYALEPDAVAEHYRAEHPDGSEPFRRPTPEHLRTLELPPDVHEGTAGVPWRPVGITGPDGAVIRYGYSGTVSEHVRHGAHLGGLYDRGPGDLGRPLDATSGQRRAPLAVELPEVLVLGRAIGAAADRVALEASARRAAVWVRFNDGRLTASPGETAVEILTRYGAGGR